MYKIHSVFTEILRFFGKSIFNLRVCPFAETSAAGSRAGVRTRDYIYIRVCVEPKS